MRVWRVEHPTDGVGPYHHAWDGLEELFGAHCDTTHPSAWEEALRDPSPWVKGLRRPPAGWRHGCGTSAALAEWFDGFWPGLAAAGFRVCVFEAPSTHVLPSGQVLFARHARQIVWWCTAGRFVDVVARRRELVSS